MLERICGFSTRFIVVLSLLLYYHACAFAQPAKPATEWISMFNGKNLDGWTAMPAHTASDWSVEDGMIIGRGSKHRSHITWKDRDVANFEMKLSYRFPGKGNSGVSIRALVDETKKRDFKSYHADFGHVGIGENVLGAWDFHTPGRTEHRCFRETAWSLPATTNQRSRQSRIRCNKKRSIKAAGTRCVSLQKTTTSSCISMANSPPILPRTYRNQKG